MEKVKKYLWSFIIGLGIFLPAVGVLGFISYHLGRLFVADCWSTMATVGIGFVALCFSGGVVVLLTIVIDYLGQKVIDYTQMQSGGDDRKR